MKQEQVIWLPSASIATNVGLTSAAARAVGWQARLRAGIEAVQTKSAEMRGWLQENEVRAQAQVLHWLSSAHPALHDLQNSDALDVDQAVYFKDTWAQQYVQHCFWLAWATFLVWAVLSATNGWVLTRVFGWSDAGCLSA